MPPILRSWPRFRAVRAARSGHPPMWKTGRHRVGGMSMNGRGIGPVRSRVNRSATAALTKSPPTKAKSATRVARSKKSRADAAIVRSEGSTRLQTSQKTEKVHAIEVRPAGTVVSRRSTTTKRKPILHIPQDAPARTAPPAWMLEECRVAPARAGDQSEILQLLSWLPTPPSRAEFHASVDHPDHDAANRLVARLGGRIVGHVEVSPRPVSIAGTGVKGAMIDRVAVLPECRGAGHGQRLVQAAERRAEAMNAVVAFSRTRIAASFRELGWSVLGRDCATPGRPATILSRLLEQPARQGPAVTMRQWRHVELPAILRIYSQNLPRFVGPLQRDETYARWLVSRGSVDSILVALVGNDRYDLHETTARIVGYCIQSGNRVLEVLADLEFAGLEREILGRVCAEAIENDRQEIVYESSPSDPLHAAVVGPLESEAIVGGSRDRMIVAKVLRPQELLSSLAAQVAARVAAAGIRETVELGLDADSFRGSIVVTGNGRLGDGDRTATVHPGRVGRSYLRLPDDELSRLLLGQSDPAEAALAGRITASTQLAIRLAGQLFPRQPLWCPMWDDLPA
jgi:GNAT superfamily N-acetyltransferase